MKKIAIISNYFLETTFPLAKYLAELGNDVVVYAYLPRANTNAFVIDYCAENVSYGFNDKLQLSKVAPEIANYMEKVQVIPFFYNGFSSRKIYKDFFGCIRLKQRIIKEKYDIVHIIGQHKSFPFIHFLLGERVNVHTLHEVTAHEGKTGIIMRWLLYLLRKNKKLKIIVHSQTSQIRLSEYYKFDKLTCEDKIFDIPFGLFETYKLYDTDKAITEKDNTVLFWGRITKYKGIDILLKAFQIVLKELPDAKLIIAGETIDEAVELNQCNDNITVINKRLTNTEIIRLNKQSSIVVCPYKSASQSGITKTTFLFNTPIIATKVGAFVEEIENGKNGLLVEPNSVEELSVAIIELLRNKELRNKMICYIQGQFQDEHSNLSWINIAKRTFEIYRQIGNE